MTIKEELRAELEEAMRQKDVPRRELIRMIETEVTLARTAPDFSGEVDDDLYRRVISAYAKKMEKAKAEFEQGGQRGAEMAAKLGWEVDYLARWLPQKLDEQATRDLVRSTVAELSAGGDPKAVGRVIGHIMKTHRDRVDGALVNRLVAEEMGGP